MKKWILTTLVVGMLPLSMMAQDDMYFVTGKQKAAKKSEPRSSYTPAAETYHTGSSRNVDEYNRRGGSSYEVLPADTGDIISFSPVEGVYPDSIGEFRVTRELTRWEGYTPTQAYWEGYSQGNQDARTSWYSPWYYSSYYPWYDSWYYDPWYYDPWYSWHYRPWYYSSWNYGWYDPWYYGSYWGWGPYYHYGWGGYYHGGGVYVTSHSGWRSGSGDYRSIPHGTGYGRYSGEVAGTRRPSRFNNSGTGSHTTTGSRATTTTGSRRTTTTSPGVRTSVPRSTGSRSYSSSSSSYSGSSSSSSSSGSRSYSSSSSSYSGSSYSSGGSRSTGGGGSFGGGGGGGGSRGGGGGGGSSRR